MFIYFEKPKETPNFEAPEIQWESISPELATVLQSQITMEVVPFDPISEKDMNEQK